MSVSNIRTRGDLVLQAIKLRNTPNDELVHVDFDIFKTNQSLSRAQIDKIKKMKSYIDSLLKNKENDIKKKEEKENNKNILEVKQIDINIHDKSSQNYPINTKNDGDLMIDIKDNLENNNIFINDWNIQSNNQEMELLWFENNEYSDTFSIEEEDPNFLFF